MEYLILDTDTELNNITGTDFYVPDPICKYI